MVGALTEQEGALRASLQQVYGIRLLKGGRTEPHRSPIELGDLVANLPPGCALWRATGGSMALTPEADLLRVIEWRLHVLAWMKTKDAQTGTNRPEPPKPIPLASQQGEKERVENAKARAWKQRQERRAATE